MMVRTTGISTAILFAKIAYLNICNASSGRQVSYERERTFFGRGNTDGRKARKSVCKGEEKLFKE
jgi:hypothetical protein